MKRVVVAGFFIALGIIILGAAAANLMGGFDTPTDKPRTAAPAAHDAPKPRSGAAANVAQPTLPSTKPAQNTAGAAPPTQYPGMPGLSPQAPGMPATLTTVQPLPPRPPAPDAIHVPIIQPTDLGTPSSPTAGRQHQ